VLHFGQIFHKLIWSYYSCRSTTEVLVRGHCRVVRKRLARSGSKISQNLVKVETRRAVGGRVLALGFFFCNVPVSIEWCRRAFNFLLPKPFHSFFIGFATLECRLVCIMWTIPKSGTNVIISETFSAKQIAVSDSKHCYFFGENGS
jgi:hypothetical protein